LDSVDSGKGLVSEFCDYGNEYLGFTKDREYLDQLNDDQLVKKDCVPW